MRINAAAADVLALAVDAGLAEAAGEAGAGEDAGAVAAEGAVAAGDALAGVLDAGALAGLVGAADLAFGAAGLVAGGGDAAALGADLVALAGDALTGVAAEAGVGRAGLALGALDAGAEADAVAVGAELAVGAAVAVAGVGALAEGAGGAAGAGAVLFVDLPVAVIVEAVAAVGGQLAAGATGVEEALVDLAVAVVVIEVADLLGGALVGAADDLTGGGALEVAGGATTEEAGGAGLGGDDGVAGGEEVDEVVAVVVEAVADLGVAIGGADVAVARVAGAVAVGVVLAAVDDLGAVVTGVADAVLVLVGLLGVGQVGAVVVDAAEAVLVGVEADATQRALQRQEREAVAREGAPAVGAVGEALAPGPGVGVLPAHQGVGEVEVVGGRLLGVAEGGRVAVAEGLGVDATPEAVVGRNGERLLGGPEIVERARRGEATHHGVEEIVLPEPAEGRLGSGIAGGDLREAIAPEPRGAHRAARAILRAVAEPAGRVLIRHQVVHDDGHLDGGALDDVLGGREARDGELGGREVALLLRAAVVPAALVLRRHVALVGIERDDPVRQGLAGGDRRPHFVLAAGGQVGREGHQVAARHVDVGDGVGVRHRTLLVDGPLNQANDHRLINRVHAIEADRAAEPAHAVALLEEGQDAQEVVLAVPVAQVPLIALGDPKELEPAVDGEVDRAGEGGGLALLRLGLRGEGEEGDGRRQASELHGVLQGKGGG